MTNADRVEAQIKLLRFFAEHNALSPPQERIVISDLDDGGMGSFKVELHGPIMAVSESKAKEYEFTDADGGIVLVTVFKKGKEISSVDFWKVDFSKLIAFPIPDDLRDATSFK